MGARVGGHIDSAQVGDLAGHLLDVGEDLGPRAEQLLGLVGKVVGVVLVEVTDRNQLEVVLAALGEGGGAVQVTATHAAASDGGVLHAFHVGAYLTSWRALRALGLGAGPAAGAHGAGLVGEAGAGVFPELGPGAPVMDLGGRILPAAGDKGMEPGAPGGLADRLVAQVERPAHS